MDCKEVQLNLNAYLEAALTDELADEMEAHINGCDACWQELLAARELCLDLNNPALSEPPPLPDDFTGMVMHCIEAEQPKGINLVWPWLRKRWTRRQYASVAYAMSATMVVVSASNVLFLWTESTSVVATWTIRVQAYWEAFQAYQAYLGVPGGYLSSLWHGLLALLQLG